MYDFQIASYTYILTNANVWLPDNCTYILTNTNVWLPDNYTYILTNTNVWLSDNWVILRQLFRILSCVYTKGKFVTNVSFATVRLINYSWDRINCLASCYIKHIYFLRLLLPWDVNICLYRHNTLNAHFLTFWFNIKHKTDMNINE